MVALDDYLKLQSRCLPATILAVSKFQPLEKIQRLYDYGHRDFAENYVQEFLQKQQSLEKLTDLRWHFIGHLQRNKVRQIIGLTELIHSVDSLKLAEEVSKQAEKNKIAQKILIQVNVAGEGSKEGFNPDQLETDWESLCQLPGIQIEGFMTMPPLANEPEQNRVFFIKLRELSNRFQQKTDLKRHGLKVLSMGTSHDFEVACDEGAHFVRLGTVLFGERRP